MVDFSKLPKTSAKKETAPADPNEAQAPAPSANALSVFGGPSATAALMAAVEANEEMSSGGQGPFPIIEVAGGNTGGAFQPRKGTPEDVADLMHQGRKPMPCVFLGYRIEAFAWASQLNQADDAETPEAKEKRAKPAWVARIASTNALDIKLLTKAFNNYTFKPKAEKEAFDIVGDKGVGHLRAAFQALVYSPDMDQLVVLAGVPLYKAFIGSCSEIRKLIDPQGGGFIHAPIQAYVRTTTEKGSKEWKCHTLCFTTNAQLDIKGMSEKWGAFIAKIKGDEQAMSDVKDWLECLDKPMTDERRESLKSSLML